MNELEKGMMLALKQAKMAFDANEVPIGAVVVCNERMIGAGFNSVIRFRDPTAHAEIIAISAAAQVLDTPYLTDCTLFTTLEPCPMCAGAIVLARMKRVVFGAYDKKFGAAGTLYNLLQDGKLNHYVEVIEGIEEYSCRELLQIFFQKIRSN